MRKGTLYGYPYLWKVECSTDNGETWTLCENAINGTTEFKMLPMVNWNYNQALKDPFTNMASTFTLTNNLEFCPGFTQQKFLLPTSASGAAKVMVKISPKSLQIAYPTDATHTATMDKAGKNCTKDYSYPCCIVIEDLAVTYSK